MHLGSTDLSSAKKPSGQTNTHKKLHRLRSWSATLANGSHHEDRKNRIIVFSVVLAGTFVVSGLLLALLSISYFMLHNEYVLARLLCAVASLVYLSVIALCAYYYRAYAVAASLLTLFYLAMGTGSVWQWGINNTFGIILMSLVVILSGILLRARFALWAAVVVSALVIMVQAAVEMGHTPEGIGFIMRSSYGDAIGYGTSFGIIGLICWLYGNQMERSLHKAERAEIILHAQKTNLEHIVRQRTAALEEKRLQELEQMYRFTQVGSLSTGLLHELANYITVLNLDIEDLRSQHSSQTMERTRQTIQYLETMIDSVRSQIRSQSDKSTFNAAQAVSQVVGILQHKAHQSRVIIDWQEPKHIEQYQYHGFSAQFNQIVTILISNAIEAYDSHHTERIVTVSLSLNNRNFVIAVTDHGKGISEPERKQLFKPFHSTKKDGMGIGLFLARRMTEVSLNGSLELSPSLDATTFTLSIPTT